jgi:hypothetical protein
MIHKVVTNDKVRFCRFPFERDTTNFRGTLDENVNKSQNQPTLLCTLTLSFAYFSRDNVPLIRKNVTKLIANLSKSEPQMFDEKSVNL